MQKNHPLYIWKFFNTYVTKQISKQINFCFALHNEQTTPQDFHSPQVVQMQKWRHGKMSVSLISLKQITHSLPSSMASSNSSSSSSSDDYQENCN